MKYSIVTFGCRVNQADSLAAEEQLLARGAARVSPEQADVVLVNTCSVTSNADQGARQTIRRIARTNPDARIIVTGCYATRSPGEVAQLPNVLRIVRNDDKAAIGAILDDLGPTTARRFGDGEGGCGAPLEPGVAGRTAFTLRVQTGCGERCSYCIIPRTRGLPRSASVAEVLQSVERAAASGFREIAVTGVHLGSYGRDLLPGRSLIDLLRELAHAFPGLLFRISSLEPMDCPSVLIDLVAGESCFAHHFHLPLQHASDNLLSAMRRPYTLEQYAELVGRIRQCLPDASIGSDVIVGFPGETSADFDHLIAYLEGSPLTHLHVFPYSDRPGTEASGLAGKVSGSTVRERALRVRTVSERLTARFKDSQVGKTHKALTLDDGSTAVTGNYLKLRIPPGRGRNEWIQIKVKSHDEGEPLSR
jgi:threonylcarbamoyladenosine tRNA methylthiotransferase MtaB